MKKSQKISQFSKQIPLHGFPLSPSQTKLQVRSLTISLACCSVSHRRNNIDIIDVPFCPLVRPRTLCKMSDSGKLVEEEEGNFALWLSYILTRFGANLFSWLFLPRKAVSVGASGAVFGLFILSAFVKVMEAAQASTALPGVVAFFLGFVFQPLHYIAHLPGALFGLVLYGFPVRFLLNLHIKKHQNLHRRSDQK